MAKKINYAAMFTLRQDGRYQGSYTDETGRHYVYDRDPERLWHKLNDPKEEKPLLFREPLNSFFHAANSFRAVLRIAFILPQHFFGGLFSLARYGTMSEIL